VDVALDLDSDPAFDVTGAYFIAGVTTRWLRERGVFGIEVRATLLEIPFRLKRSTPKPRIHGLQSATVTGAQGREIQPDGLGRVHLRFHWDCAGPRDHTSSPPFRVVQPHLPGALITPRVGWECFVMFDDGIPEQPYVLGRSYNGKQTPPLALPANKTVSSIATDSSPGGGARAVLQFDDAAGREHLLVNAPSSKLKQVSANNTMQVMKNEGYLVKGSLTASVGATESISVKLGWLGKYGTRAVSVGAAQHQNAAGNFVTSTGTTQVVVGAAVLEQVGDPVSGAANLLKDTALARIGATGALGAVVAAAAGIGLAAKDGAEQGGEAGALAAAERSALGVGMSFIPGGEAILSQVLGSSKPLPWDHGEPEKGDVAPGGGAAAASGGDGGPAAPGPGHRGTLVNGSYSEMVGAGYAIATPGSVSWVTLGAATVMVNGSHTTSALHAGMTAAGGMLDSAGSIKATSKADVVRKVLGWLNTSISGSLNVLAGREYQLTVKSALDLKVDGALDLNASTVTFKCGSAVISASSGGVKISAPSIKVTGASKQSGSLSHK
jgi:type VI secretion system secreted protein VgrG